MPESEGPDPWLDHLAVADDDDREAVRLEVGAGDALDVGSGARTSADARLVFNMLRILPPAVVKYAS